ncbi:MAG: response regulator transcription factor [Lachnospiraceae bacterium]|nr:response regulator transcription factor [Lachnospiraceae bacterium]
MDKIKILMADDEERMRKLVRDFLTRDGFDVIECANGLDAVDTFEADPSISLIIMDVMMPVLDGWAAVEAIRKNSKVPIIMLTAKSEEKDELKGFSLGVDEYISKPFSPKILVARVNALLNRVNPDASRNKELIAGSITMNRASHTVSVEGKPIELSVKEFDLLEYFIENKGIALSRENILNNVWDYDYFGEARTIDTHVKKLRAKLGKDAGDMIKTIWGMGYKFEV